MICLGRVSHLNSSNLAIILAKEKVSKNTKIFDSENNHVGRVVNIFGPVKQPYLAISANKGFRITRLVGREIYRK
jgi:RNA-binding protein|tara:strand:+ start:7595 stop:7819 length:225 start_codon:yes stop_codon:yes gene_type:complete